MGFAPAFRTGCKLAVINPSGNYRRMPRFTHRTAKPCGRIKRNMKRLIDEYQVDIISIGNGNCQQGKRTVCG
jgi:uncharacterized protein